MRQAPPRLLHTRRQSGSIRSWQECTRAETSHIGVNARKHHIARVQYRPYDVHSSRIHLFSGMQEAIAHCYFRNLHEPACCPCTSGCTRKLIDASLFRSRTVQSIFLVQINHSAPMMYARRCIIGQARLGRTRPPPAWEKRDALHLESCDVSHEFLHEYGMNDSYARLTQVLGPCVKSVLL